MENVAYGLFEDRARADAAMAELERRGLPADAVRIDEYVGDLPDEELPGPATRARTYALIGGGIAAVLGAVAGALMFEGTFGVNRLAFAGLTGLGAGLLGALVSGIAGAAIPRRQIEVLKPDIAAGKSLITIEVRTKHTTRDLVTELRELGALRAGML